MYRGRALLAGTSLQTGPKLVWTGAVTSFCFWFVFCFCVLFGFLRLVLAVLCVCVVLSVWGLCVSGGFVFGVFGGVLFLFLFVVLL